MDVTNVMHVHVALVLVVLVLVAATMAVAAKKPKRLGGETGLTRVVTTDAAATTNAAVTNSATFLIGSIK
jgi:hypothetical protein